LTVVVDRRLDYYMASGEPPEVMFQILDVLLDGGPRRLCQQEIA
jgi:hypothetical protein